MFAIYNERHESKIVRGNIHDVTRGFVKETRSPCPPSTGMLHTGHAHLIFKFVGITCRARAALIYSNVFVLVTRFLLSLTTKTATPAKEKSKAICIIVDDDLFISRSDLHLA